MFRIDCTFQHSTMKYPEEIPSTSTASEVSTTATCAEEQPTSSLPNDIVCIENLSVIAMSAPMGDYDRSDVLHLKKYYKETLSRKIPSIEIKPYKNLFTPNTEVSVYQSTLKQLHLTHQDVVDLLMHGMSLFLNPIDCLKQLKSVDEDLGKEIVTKGLLFTSKQDPAFHIISVGCILPGPPPEGALTKKKGRIIDDVLLRNEAAFGLNKEGSPIFIGLVDNDTADQFIAKGYTFKEDVDVSNLLLHGKHSHRLQILALLQSLKGTRFKHIPAKDILKLLVEVKVKPDTFGHRSGQVISGWNFLIDTQNDVITPVNETPERNIKALIDIEKFNYSCRSPFVFHSLLLSFGDKLGLPNLMHCLRDSFWKSVGKHIRRFKEYFEFKDFTDQETYLIVLEMLAVSRYGASSAGSNYFFSLSPAIAAKNSNYEQYPHQLDPNIRRKKIPIPKASVISLHPFAKDQEPAI